MPSPPRLIASQNFVMQTIDSDWHAGQSAATTAAAEKLNAEPGKAAENGGIALLLLDPDTNEPFRHRAYRLELTNTVIEGTTDEHGATRKLTAAEREAVVSWHVGRANAA